MVPADMINEAMRIDYVHIRYIVCLCHPIVEQFILSSDTFMVALRMEILKLLNRIIFQRIYFPKNYNCLTPAHCLRDISA